MTQISNSDRAHKIATRKKKHNLMNLNRFMLVSCCSHTNIITHQQRLAVVNVGRTHKERENRNWSGFTQFLAPTGFPFIRKIIGKSMGNLGNMDTVPIRTALIIHQTFTRYVHQAVSRETHGVNENWKSWQLAIPNDMQTLSFKHPTGNDRST